MSVLHSRYMSLAEAQIDAARELLLGERVGKMRRNHLYWTGPSTFAVDEQMRLWAKADGRICWNRRVWAGDIGLQNFDGFLSVRFPADELDHWRPRVTSAEDRARLLPVTTVFLGFQKYVASDASGHALLPPDLATPAVGELEDGGRGYIQRTPGLASATSIDVETEFSRRPDFVIGSLCERDGGDLLVEIEPGGEVRRLELVGRLAPGRERGGTAVFVHEPQVQVRRPLDVVASLVGNGPLAAAKQTRPRFSEDFVTQTLARMGRSSGEAAWAGSPSLRERAPARRAEPPSLR